MLQRRGNQRVVSHKQKGGYNTIRGEGSGYMAITQRVGFGIIPLACELYPQYHTHTHTHTQLLYRE